MRGLVPLTALPLVPSVRRTSPCGLSFMTVCAPTSVVQMLPSLSMRRPWLRVNKPSPKGANEFAVFIEFRERLRAAAQDVKMTLGIEGDARGRSHFRSAGTGMGSATAT